MIKILVLLSTLCISSIVMADAASDAVAAKKIKEVASEAKAGTLSQSTQATPSKAAAHKEDSSHAEVVKLDSDGHRVTADDSSKYQTIIEDYKAYIASVDKSVRDEVAEFRKGTAKLNKQKSDMYKSLSQEAQGYLAKERELKSKLPRDHRKSLSDVKS